MSLSLSERKNSSKTSQAIRTGVKNPKSLKGRIDIPDVIQKLANKTLSLVLSCFMES